MHRKSRAGVNRRWHRADLEISPVACAVIAAVVIVVLIIAAVSS